MNNYCFKSSDGSPEDFEELFYAAIVAFDVEATGVNTSTSLPYGFSLSHKPGTAYYTAIETDFFRKLLVAGGKLCIAHNAKYDRSMMKKAGVIIDNLADTMIAAHLLEEPELNLKALALKYLVMDIMAFKDLDSNLANMALQQMAEYSCPHSIAALGLWAKFEPLLKRHQLLNVFWNVEMPLIPVLSDMELNGVMVDHSVLKSLGEEFDHKIAVLVEALDYWSGCPGMNHNSPDQVRSLLYGKLKLPKGPLTGKGRKPSIRADYLETIKHRHNYVPWYLQFKQYLKLKSTYVIGLLDKIVDGRIYASFNQTGTRTGRLSSSNPNLQNIPQRSPEGRRIRTAFAAPPGYTLIKADYDQLELRMIAHYSRCIPMIRSFLKGEDIHEQTAIRVFGDKKRRADGKTLNFAIAYGGGDPKQSQKFFEAYPEVKRWREQAIRQAHDDLCVRTLFGRNRNIVEYDSIFTAARGDREAVNTIIQGSAAEVVKIGMRRAWEALKYSGAKMVLQVHDEVVLEVSEKELTGVIRTLKDSLTYEELLVPFTVSISTGQNWGQMAALTDMQITK